MTLDSKAKLLNYQRESESYAEDIWVKVWNSGRFSASIPVLVATSLGTLLFICGQKASSPKAIRHPACHFLSSFEDSHPIQTVANHGELPL